MLSSLKIVAYDLDTECLHTLQQAFPEWQIQVKAGGTLDTLERDWNPGPAALMVLSACPRVTQTLGVCRALRSQAGRAHTPLLVLVPPAAEALVRAALDAGANGCLVVPVHAKEFVHAVAQFERGNQPGRHTRSLEPAQMQDQWRDEGGEG
jgi:DNA-binding response OmpR family regulator